jgi:hypothetical protein
MIRFSRTATGPILPVGGPPIPTPERSRPLIFFFHHVGRDHLLLSSIHRELHARDGCRRRGDKSFAHVGASSQRGRRGSSLSHEVVAAALLRKCLAAPDHGLHLHCTTNITRLTIASRNRWFTCSMLTTKSVTTTSGDAG